VGPVKCKPVVNWYKLVLELAKDFGLDLDFFKRHHVVELYSCGHDKEAEEVNIHIDDSICRITLVISSPGHRPCELLSWVSVRCSPIGKRFTILVQDHPMIIPAKSQFN
jgi:hypothetical protein